jgi:hypothetical protein
VGVVVVSQTQTAGVSHRPSSVSAAPLWLPCGVERKRRVGAGGRTARAPGGAVRLSSTSRPSVRPSVLVVGVGACFVCLCFGAIAAELRCAVRSHFSTRGAGFSLFACYLCHFYCRYKILIVTRCSMPPPSLSLSFFLVYLSSCLLALPVKCTVVSPAPGAHAQSRRPFAPSSPRGVP